MPAGTGSGSSSTPTNQGTFTLAPPVPQTITPLSGTSTGGTSVTLTGSGFRTGATVAIGGSACAGPNVVSASEIHCVTSGHPAGAASVVVTNPDNQTGTIASGYVYNLAPAPTLSAIAPANGPSAGGTLVTITGTNLATGASIYIGGSACSAVTVGGATSATCITPAHTLQVGASVALINSDNQSATLTGAYTFQPPTPLAIAPIGGNDGGGTAVTISGHYFTSVNGVSPNVSIGGAGCNGVTVVNEGQITCTTTAHVVQTGVNVQVTNPDTASGTLAGAYAYRKAPLVSSITPANGPLAGGTAVTVTGNYFVTTGGTTTVSIGSVPCGAVSVISATQINCTTAAAGAAGPGAVVVTSIDGQVSNTNVNFLYYGPLKLTAASYAIQINGTFAFPAAVSGGVPPYNYSLAAAPVGSISLSGTYTAPAAAGGPDTVNISDSATVPNSTSATIRTLKPAKVGLGYTASCAILNDATSAGNLKCWGDNQYGQLGLDDQVTRGGTTGTMGGALPVVNIGGSVVDVTGGLSHTCARTSLNYVKCWGGNTYGQLGQNNTTSVGNGLGTPMASLPFINLGTGRTATQIAVGGSHTCALLDNATVKCWGLNSSGQLGYNDTINRGGGTTDMGDNLLAITLPAGFGTPSAIAAGDAHTCAMSSTGNVLCWGKNNAGQLGQGNTAAIGNSGTATVAGAPLVSLGAGLTATAISAGGNMTCAQLTNGSVASIKCWGSGGFGQLGQGSTANAGDGVGSAVSALANINFGGGVTVLGVYAAHTQPGAASEGEYACALLSISAANATRCWGLGGSGQLGQYSTANAGDGIGTSVAMLASIDVGTGRTPQQVVAGASQTCALLDNFTVKCWGRNSLGQLGQENVTNRGDSAVATPNDHRMGDNLPAIQL